MPSYLTSILLEFSEDDLSDTTPTFQDVTSYLYGRQGEALIEWWSGVDNEGDEPQPGGAILRFRGRDWEPDNTAGRFYPNVVYGRRFRLTLNDGTGATQEGLWYITDIAIDYPAGTTYSEVTITCADGFEILALDSVESLDPPSAESYADVGAFDEPWGYWRKGEPEGTKLVSHLRVRKTGKGKNRRKMRRRWLTAETSSEATGAAGPSGIYVNTPTLGEAGLILGDQDTAVTFAAASSEYAQIALQTDEAVGDNNRITLECWANSRTAPEADYTNGVLICGPHNSGAALHVWTLSLVNIAGDISAEMACWFTDGTSASASVTIVGFATGQTHHYVGTWDGMKVRLYIDGSLEAVSSSAPRTLRVGGSSAAEHNVWISRDVVQAEFFDGTIDEVAIYETALSSERILAHYTAGSARGWPEQTAGFRIGDICSNPLWSNALVQTSGLNVQPQMKHGQAKLEEISELMQAEGPRTLFFFNGARHPIYLGDEFQTLTAPYNTVQATFGDGAGEVSYEDVELIYDNETFNVVEASREGGELISVGAGGIPRRVNSEFTDLLLTDDVYVESLAGHVLDLYDAPAMRPKTITVNGAKAVNKILYLGIGMLVRVKKRGTGGVVAIDRVTHILGYRKTLTADKHITCAYNLARGFNAADGFWKVGISGFSEIGQTTKVA